MKDTSTIDGKPLLDAESFQKLLAAAYVLQEHNDNLQNAGADNGSATPPQPQSQDNLDQPALAQSPASDYTQTLAEIVATQQQIQMSHMDLQDTMHLIADRARHITGAAGGAIGLVEEDQLVYRAASGSAQGRIGERVPSSSCLSTQCLSQGESVYCRDVNRDSRVDHTLCNQYGIQGFIAVPIFYEGKIVGSIELDFSEANAFQEDDVRSAQLMAGLITEGQTRAAQVEWKQALTTERATMLDALTRLKPDLRRLVSEPKTTSGDNPSSAAAPLANEETTCTECGNQLEADVLFCGQCGTERPRVLLGDVGNKYRSIWEPSQAPEKAGVHSAEDINSLMATARESFVSTKVTDSSGMAHAPDFLFGVESVGSSLEVVGGPACGHLPRACLGSGDRCYRVGHLVEAAKPSSGIIQSGNIFWKCGYHVPPAAQTA